LRLVDGHSKDQPDWELKSLEWIFSGKMEEVSAFINAARIYIRMKMIEEAATTQVAWVLSYVQGGVAEAWKDNLLDELAKGKSEVESAE